MLTGFIEIGFRKKFLDFIHIAAFNRPRQNKLLAAKVILGIQIRILSTSLYQKNENHYEASN